MSIVIGAAIAVLTGIGAGSASALPRQRPRTLSHASLKRQTKSSVPSSSAVPWPKLPPSTA